MEQKCLPGSQYSHHYVNGIRGQLHGADFQIADPETVYPLSAKLLSLMAVELLWGDGSEASKIIQEYRPVFKSKEEYQRFADGLFSKKVFDITTNLPGW